MPSTSNVRVHATCLRRLRPCAKINRANPASAAVRCPPRRTSRGKYCSKITRRSANEGVTAEITFTIPIKATRMAANCTPQISVNVRWLEPNNCIRWTAKKPTAIGIQKVSPRNASATVVATAPLMPKEVKTNAMAPSTTPIPWGVIDTIQNSTPTA